MTVPNVNETGVDCDAKLADLTRAVELGNGVIEDMRRRSEVLSDEFERLTEVVYKLVVAVNTLGAQSQAHTDQTTAILAQISQFGATISSMGPAGMLKAVMGSKGKNNG